MGGLSELGDSAESEMKALGAYAKSKGIDRLIATGSGARLLMAMVRLPSISQPTMR